MKATRNEKKNEHSFILLRVSPQEKKWIEQHAEAENYSTTSCFIRKTLLDIVKGKNSSTPPYQAL